MKLVSMVSATVLHCILSGCAELCPRDPLFCSNDGASDSRLSNVLCNKDTWLTYDVLVSYGWDSIYKASDPRFDVMNSVATAQTCFDEAWKMKKTGYDAYWGWGIVRIMQAERTLFRSTRRRYLREAIEFMELAKNKPTFEAIRFNSIQLDIAKCYWLLGREYQEANRMAERRECFEKVRKIIDTLEQMDDYEKQRAKDLRISLL